MGWGPVVLRVEAFSLAEFSSEPFFIAAAYRADSWGQR